MVERALIEIVEQGCMDTIFASNVDTLAMSTQFMDTQTIWAVGNKSNIMQISGFVKRHVQRMLEELCSRRH